MFEVSLGALVGVEADGFACNTVGAAVSGVCSGSDVASAYSKGVERGSISAGAAIRDFHHQ